MVRALKKIVAGLILLTLVSCEEELPFAEGIDEPFTLFGVFSPQIDTQWVRVFPIQQSLEPLPNGPIDAEVKSVNLNTGEEREWNLRVIEESTGQFTHAYWSDLIPIYGHSYELSVRRSDGATSLVRVDMPPETEFDIREADLDLPVTIPVVLRGGAPKIILITMDYTVKYGTTFNQTARYVFEYLGQIRDIQGDWEIPLTLATEYENLVGRLDIDELFDDDYGLDMLQMKMDLRVVNREWAFPDSDLELAEVLVEPGVLSNVTNGLGFVGAGYRSTLDWIPPTEVLEAAGFRPLPDTSDTRIIRLLD